MLTKNFLHVLPVLFLNKIILKVEIVKNNDFSQLLFGSGSDPNQGNCQEPDRKNSMYFEPKR